MKFALLRSIQLFAMIIILSGLYIGIRDNNVMLELNALIVGAGIFYAVNSVIKKSI
ncbi:MAG: hypothetical protein QF847_02820 [Candidatus Marinimicrobia bacterium]|jgi:hypothetical protein|nr:hypothetical protein [Candidatus Neomarinimicrobiota bacterium]MDP6229622.1 hypothetical protein [Candidatus Neomarinimicrobiota bacterium]MDP6500555.1 hypothetical protein [Candidatus Neomarinimicrobiota bacterium]MDP6726172.1 hypothetical protein [Candidatus Neomarinimicrobiota bacterium]MDP7095604.1 hypothetical protein [Candidatus Neomarinimicrobiota bacterium]|tara:strand:+ start:2109 stop:2276 length:168 start_codon:yes stop_codon:yes gene_type:complete